MEQSAQQRPIKMNRSKTTTVDTRNNFFLRIFIGMFIKIQQRQRHGPKRTQRILCQIRFRMVCCKIVDRATKICRLCIFFSLNGNNGLLFRCSTNCSPRTKCYKCRHIKDRFQDNGFQKKTKKFVNSKNNAKFCLKKNTKQT